MSLEDEVMLLAALNAAQHGKAMQGPVMNALLSAHPELRSEVKRVADLVGDAVTRVNGMTRDQLMAVLSQLEPLRREQEERMKEIKKKKEKEEGGSPLPALPGAEEGSVVTRFAPNPDAPLHLGNARALVLSAEYARLYKGKFILRFEDTDPHVKPPIPEAYEWIREDVRWLGYSWDKEWVQSQHLSNYYDVVRQLIQKGAAYVCTCSAEHFQQLRRMGDACPHRGESQEEALSLFEKMVSGGFDEGEAVVRMKTDMKLPNPALRDFPLMRVVNPKRHPHPMLKDGAWAFPLYNLSAAVDDHLLGITHVLRGKEHMTNDRAQGYIYEAMGWKQPFSVEHGRLMLEGIPLSKSQVRKALAGGVYNGWDDPRLGTLMALRRRGFSPKAIIDLMIEVGPKPTDAMISWDNLYALNRRYLEPISRRYFVVRDPVMISVEGLGDRVVEALLHPDHPEMGKRRIEVKGGKVFVQRDDLGGPGTVIRLMELATVKYLGEGKASVLDIGPEQSVTEGITRVHWVPVASALPVKVVTPDGLIDALAENNISAEGVNSTVQMVRWGFARVDLAEPGEFTLYFAHR